jgi:hypothetical protein
VERLAVLLLGLERHGLGVLAVTDQSLDLVLGRERLLGERLHLDEVCGRLLASLGHLRGGVRDLVLVHPEQDLGGAQVGVLVVLLGDQRAARLALAGDVGGRLGVHDRGERDQVGVALLEDRRDRVDRGLVLVVEGLLAGGDVGACLLEPGLRRGEGVAHLLVTLLRDGQPGPHVAQLGPCLGQLLAGVRQCLGGLPQTGAGLVEVVVGPLDLAVHLALLVAQLAGVRLRYEDRERADRHGDRSGDRGRASATDAGEGTHLFAFGCSGK